MPSVANIKSGKIFKGATQNFSNLKDVDDFLIRVTREAYKLTLRDMERKLREFIAEDVYDSAYTSKTLSKKNTLNNYKYKSQWGGRTNTLLDERSIETYVYNAFGKGIGGGIRFNSQPYYENMDLQHYVHGNPYFGQLAFQSYLEMLNNNMLLVDNPFGFPTFRDFHRDSFWYDFTKWAEEHFHKLYEYHFNLLLGNKPKATGGSSTQSSMNLSSSTSNIKSLDTKNMSEKVDKTLKFKITIE